jgi:hypothetical protein
VNIGDVAHTPGLLALIEEQLPDVEVRLWPSSVAGGVEAMLRRRFPRLTIVQGEEARAAAFRECDFLLHGSGPSLVAERDVRRWRQETGKPFGVFGITLPVYPPEVKSPTVAAVADSTIELLSEAAFVYFRDSVSLAHARERGCRSAVMAFGPDAAFATDVRNDAAAQAFLQQHKLTPKKFLCCIPRFRHTPYWLIHNRPRDEVKHARNVAMVEHDHAPLRAAIEAVVRETEMQVLLCPEDETQVALGRDLLLNRLPADVRGRVVWRDSFWLADEAVSTYRQGAGLFGLEMHSPILCVGQGIPAIVGRFAEQTNKGYMWRDVGLDNWLFDFDRADDIERFVPAVLALARDNAAACTLASAARDRVRTLHRTMIGTLSAHWRS